MHSMYSVRGALSCLALTGCVPDAGTLLTVDVSAPQDVGNGDVVLDSASNYEGASVFNGTYRLGTYCGGQDTNFSATFNDEGPAIRDVELRAWLVPVEECVPEVLGAPEEAMLPSGLPWAQLLALPIEELGPFGDAYDMVTLTLVSPM